MKLIDNILYIEFAEMVTCGFSENYMSKAKSTNAKCWHFINDPADKRKVLIGYEALNPINKQKVIACFGDVYERIAIQPILNMVMQDAAANLYYQQYNYGNCQYLPINSIKKYTRAASWLNMIANVQGNKGLLKGLGINTVLFYKIAGSLIAIEILNGKNAAYSGFEMLPGNFPTTYQRLLERLKKYRDAGYNYLIAPQYGNKRAAKIGKTAYGFDGDLERKQLAVIRKVASMHNNFDAAQVAKLSNILFEKNGWFTIGKSCTYKLMQKYAVLLTPGRKGRRAFNSTMAMQMKREVPKYPTDYWTLDGWTVELLYQDNTGYSNRLVMVVVLDAVNKYPVGYAIGDRENAELIREANRNAIRHMKELFGEYYHPYQLQSDRYALKSLTPFYQAMAHLHTPAAVGNAKAKIIEPYFKYLNKEYCQLHKNWSGFNIDAKKSNQVNREMLDMIKRDFPNKNGVINQVTRFMEVERAKKVEAYKAAWQYMPQDEKKILSQMDWIMLFGKPIGRTNSITGEGIVKMIDGCLMTYDCFEQSFRDQHYNIDWQIIADSNNLNYVVAASPDYRVRYLLENKMTVPMGTRRTTPEHLEYRNRVTVFNEAQKQNVINTYAQDAEITKTIIDNTPLAIDHYQEAALKLMFTRNGQQKELIQDAKRLQAIEKKEQKQIAAKMQEKANDWQLIQASYLNSKTDFNKYLD